MRQLYRLWPTVCVALAPGLASASVSTSCAASAMDVVVVGGGLAGLCATIEAAKRGAKVTIIDKEANLGGNSAKASSGMNGANTQAQRDQGITDSVEKFIEDTLSSGDGLAVVELVHTLAEQSRETHEWLKSLGLHLSDVVQLGGHSTARTHRFPPTPEGKPQPVGWTLVSGLRKILETELKDQVTIRTKSSFKELLIEDGRVMGLNFEHENGTEQLRGTVVLTAGGYANDHADSSLLDLHTPALAKLPTTNGPFATGDVIKALVKQEAGVKTTLMDKVQIHPTGFIEVKQPNFHTKFLAPEALRGSGGILLCHGKRFANELGRRDYLTEEMFKHCKPLFDKEENPLSAAMLLTEEAVEKYGSGAMGFYKFKGLVQDVGTVEAAAEAMGTSAEVLKKTLEDYNEAAERGQDKFGKKVFPVRFPSTAHLYVAFVTPTCFNVQKGTVGGIPRNRGRSALVTQTRTGIGLPSRPGVVPGVNGAACMAYYMERLGYDVIRKGASGQPLVTRIGLSKALGWPIPWSPFWASKSDRWTDVQGSPAPLHM
ncbi:unnamed protein product [Durusdinium trenchii]|uniref:FAD-dependent oxidoreductase 2 FAD-binding domain-containing protein n=1 Tax=Durusdinium trenchii TaxID=1381693 RepID=A0ABP0PZ53_9DINO